MPPVIPIPLNLALIKTLSRGSARYILTTAKAYYAACALLSVAATSTSFAAAFGFGIYLTNAVKYNRGKDKEFFMKGLLVSLAILILSFTYMSLKAIEYARFKQVFLPELEKIATQ